MTNQQTSQVVSINDLRVGDTLDQIGVLRGRVTSVEFVPAGIITRAWVRVEGYDHAIGFGPRDLIRVAR